MEKFLITYLPVFSAIIAAFAAIFAAWLSAIGQKKATYSKIVMEQSIQLLKSTYRSVALADIILKRNKNGETIKQYLNKGNEEFYFLKNEAESFRYLLREGTCGLRILSRLRSWMIQKKDDIEAQECLVKYANILSKKIEYAVIYSIENGKKPPQSYINDIKKYVDILHKIWNLRKSS
ncbi:hypothetical protein [Desulfovibrio sp.]|uniref:hypothetical protein n=1 Tax=Desulfovibrio sp. TaxID=885 RepID=UPI0025C4FF3D|nr:hypothetical protein [Desulfovibrio sp.]